MTKRYPALAGVAAAAVALGLGELVASLVSARSAPLVAVGSAVIDAAPGPVKDFAIGLFGTNDKLALQIGTAVVLFVIAAGLGILAARRLWVGLLGIAAFAAIGAASALTRGGADVTWAIPSIVGGLGAGLVLWPLAPRAASLTKADRLQRRRFLTATGAAVGLAAIGGYLGRQFGQSAAVNSARRAVTLPTPSGTMPTAPPDASVAGLGYVTPNNVFYRIDTAIVVPRVDPRDWTLKIHGRVGNPMTLTWDDLLRRPMIERYITLTCVSNDVGGNLVGNAKWLGVPLKDLLEQVRPDPGADQVVGRSVDGFTAGSPTAVLMDGRDAMIAVAMNGEPLPLEHGFPARVVVPGLYGYVSATKWLSELELTSFADFDAYWVPRGWSAQAPIKTESRIDRPRAGSSTPAGPVVVAGVAWAQHRGISKVEVQVDDGPWQTATLASVASVDTWRLWSWTWPAAAGRHTLRVRATDNAGEVQTAAAAPPVPNGATGYHTISVTIA
jgi:DMSO/TMAO reductase YedYZ molybdopterin-dependent catalytic subunit